MDDATLEALSFKLSAGDPMDESPEYNDACQAILDLLIEKPDLTGWEITRAFGNENELSRLVIQQMVFAMMLDGRIDTGEYLPTVPHMELGCRVA